VELLFSIVRQLKAAGRSVVFVSHRLDELFAVCDRVTVLRDGRTVKVSPIAQISKLELVTVMLGKELSAVHRERRQHRAADGGVPLLAVHEVQAPPRLRSASLAVHAGQTLGLAGLLGAGRTELMRALFGADTVQAGRIELEGRPLQLRSPADAIAQGIAYLSEDRKTEGIFPDLSVRENLTIVLLPRLARAGVVDRARQQQIVQRFIERLGIKAHDAEQPVRELSGGNQQKVLIARWLAMQPKLLMLDEPTRGVDVGAKADIARLAGELAEAGMGILLTTSELEELVALSDAAVVVREGRTVARLDGQGLDEAALMSAMAEGSAR
jgi:ribose transport system ATP-binding protein